MHHTEGTSLVRFVRRLDAEAAVSLRKRRRWYADAPEPPADKPAPGGQSTPAQPDKPTQEGDDVGSPDDKPETFSREYVMELRKENKQRRTAQRELEQRLSALETERREQEDAELKEQNLYKELADKKQKELDQLQAQLKAERLNAQRVSIAAKFSDRLPKSGDPKVDTVAEFAALLQGDTEESLREHAERLIALFGVSASAAQPATPPPAPAAPGSEARRQTTTAVPGGQPVTRSDEDRRKDYFGTSAKDSPIFAKGKLIMHSKSEEVE